VFRLPLSIPVVVAALALGSALAYPLNARADADDLAGTAPSTTLGMQPLRGPIPVATPAPGESRLFRRPDGTWQAIPVVRGSTKIFNIVERQAPWTLKPGLTVMANTYDGVVPGPTIVVNQGDRVIINYTNDGMVGDTIHMHGIHDIPITMDGVPGISQPPVMPGQHCQYRFTAVAPGTFIYHTHDNEEMLDSGLYGGIIVEPSQPLPVERGLGGDFLEVLSSWKVQSASEDEFTINGKEYPDTQPINVHEGERFRIRWINISGEEFHTMHTHGHYQRVIARDAEPVDYRDVEDTVLVGPGQRVDVVVRADAKPGTWLVHCHVADHTENAQGLPDGLITAIHYIGTPNTMTAMYPAMVKAMSGKNVASQGRGLSFWMTVLLGAIAGFTIFLGLPVARARRISAQTVALLNALAIGILLYLVIEIAQNATAPIVSQMTAWHGGAAAFPYALVVVFIVGLLLGLVGLGSGASRLALRAASATSTDHPMVLAMLIAIGIGAHNFGEGLAIGASAASGATAIAVSLIIGFGLHNATEGFGVAAPLVGRMIPSWPQIAFAGLIAGGPTFLGTIVGYAFTSPVLSVLFLAIAIGALVYVIGEMWSVLRRTGLTAAATTVMTVGFLLAFATEVFLDLNGG
jgi:ZIP family zinc transporter